MVDKIWADAAFVVVCQVAKAKPEFTPDDIWEAGLHKPNDARALGGVMRRASSKKLIEKTGRSQATRQPESHGTDVTVWRSLIYGVNLGPDVLL
ncbi:MULTISPECIES: hypothetical protein [unclassified Pseudomonas]|uniref:hypothetical protein n=1 Tax=unclassified Pseudomonas TaxID=196821 RepID=UPI00111236EF|nr:MULTISPECIES: hypothetical protein [unclassified Pseudomonas]MDO4236882.1 hypothetical protein [Pseudomonas sp.]